MMRKSMKMLLLAVLAVFALATTSEAAGKKTTIHKRPKHSTRVAAGPAGTTKKKTRTTKKSTTTVKKKPTTKPR